MKVSSPISPMIVANGRKVSIDNLSCMCGDNIGGLLVGDNLYAILR
jgi:hypothetical protein